MERDALMNRLELVQQGSDQLDKMIQDESKMVEAKNVLARRSIICNPQERGWTCGAPQL